MQDGKLYLAPHACSACRSKKRKCDKVLPSCSRCQRVLHACQYSLQSMNTEESPGRIIEWIGPQKWVAACKKCREGKRLCDRNLPSCSRCAHTNAPCIYDRPSHRVEGLSSKFADAKYHASQEGAILAEQSLRTIDHIGQAGFDPFHTYPSTRSPECVTRILTYSTKQMWPNLFPGYTYKGVSFVYHWVQSAMNCPPLFNAWLHSGAAHMQLQAQASGYAVKPSSHVMYEMLLMEREAILGLKELAENGRAADITDEIVMTALALALHHAEGTRSVTPRMSLVPLSNLQWLSRFTNIDISEAHLRVLRYLVRARGGFDQLEMPGLQQGLTTFNLVVASKYLTHPFWPLRTCLQRDDIAKYLAEIAPTELPNSTLFESWLNLGPLQCLSWEFYAIRGYTALLKGYSQGTIIDLDLGLILEMRNNIHYHVMSLPTPDEISDSDLHSLQTYAVCRLGLIAYSLLVLFPVPLMMEPYPRLVDLLRSELDSLFWDINMGMVYGDLLLWVLMIGGMASLGTAHRSWYVAQLHYLIGVLGIECWEQLKDKVSTVVWLDYPCDEEGLVLWEEIQNSSC